MNRYWRFQGGRGTGKTDFTLNWVTCLARAGAKHILLAASTSFSADRLLRDQLREREPVLFQRIKLQTACPQRDEFCLRGSRYDAAVAEDIDYWPLVFVDPNDEENHAQCSVLLDEILAYTHGPILFTYGNPDATLVKQIPTAM